MKSEYGLMLALAASLAIMTALAVYEDDLSGLEETLVLSKVGCDAYRALDGKIEAMADGLCRVSGQINYTFRQIKIDGIAIDRTQIVANRSNNPSKAMNLMTGLWIGVIGIGMLILVAAGFVVFGRRKKGTAHA